MQKRKGAMTFHCQKCHATAAKCKKKKLNDSCCQKTHAIEAKSEKKELSDFTLPRKESNRGKKKKKDLELISLFSYISFANNTLILQSINWSKTL
jgi:hypothetical protein